jgi:predicted RNA-binding Zn-ribbon protein involved in translation (DUF1610 family)
MDINSQKLEKTSKIIYYSISVILCVFLILLCNKIIDDIDSASRRPLPERFEDKAKLSVLIAKQNALDLQIENLNSQKSLFEKTIQTATENYASEKQSFDNWVQTRRTLGSPDKDQEVIDRAKRLDEIYKIKDDWRAKLDSKQSEIEAVSKQNNALQKLIDNEKSKTQNRYDKAVRQYELKVFLIRLLIVAPILALGIFFFIRYRRHKFWPLYFGFTLFAFYAFFFGLVPYLPSYGGYIRYTVGIIVSVGLGYYAIKTIRKYIDDRQAELKVSTDERSKKVQTEVAEKAFENHYCPSCGKDFMIKKWEFPVKGKENDIQSVTTDFCRHCGLELFSNCAKCENKNFAHLPFCSSCGTRTSKDTN